MPSSCWLACNKDPCVVLGLVLFGRLLCARRTPPLGIVSERLRAEQRRKVTPRPTTPLTPPRRKAPKLGQARAEATTMDPGRSTQVLTVNYFVNVYDTLTRWDTALQLTPGLATAWKTVNDTTWEFTLRPNVKFHDGSPFTAEGRSRPRSSAICSGQDRGHARLLPPSRRCQVVSSAHHPHSHQEARSAHGGAHGPDGLPDPARPPHH